MTIKDWKKEDIDKLIDGEVGESLNLEYKSCGGLGKTDEKKKEISKDVSSFANSDGGVIVYGIKEYDQDDKKHLPERIDEGFDPADITKEWLEQVIFSNVRPKINVLIHQIPVGITNKVIYVVDVPKGETAYQAKDHRYYRRHNFQSVPMEDYEIRDVMNRKKVPDVQLVAVQRQLPSSNEFELNINLINNSEIVIKYFRVELSLPADLVMQKRGYSRIEKFLKLFRHFALQPKVVNYEKFAFNNPSDSGVVFPNEQFILLPSAMDPVRTLVYRWIDDVQFYGYTLMWRIYADNMPFREGEIELERIEHKRTDVVA